MEEVVVKEIVNANAEAVYKDSVQPSVRVLGKSLAQCISLFATPVGRTAEILEKNIHRYLDRLEGLKEEDLVSPDTRVLVPILEKMRFIDEEKVADYYAKILATASLKEHSSKVMVTFIEILNRLTSDEISILEYINSDHNKVEIPELTELEIKQHGLSKEIKFISTFGSFPVLDVKIKNEGLTGYKILQKNFNNLTNTIEFTSPENIDSYIDNMTSLGLIERIHDFRFALDKVYSQLENHPNIISLKKVIESEPGKKVEFNRGRIDITGLGEKLLLICSNKE
jgi:hypothetical protein